MVRKEIKEEIKAEASEIKKEADRAGKEFKSDVIDQQDPNVIAALGYIWILFLIPLLGKRDSEFCQHHAKQGLVLFVFSLIVSILMVIPPLGFLGWIITVILMLLGIVNALKGEMWEMPYLGKFAKKIKF